MRCRSLSAVTTLAVFLALPMIGDAQAAPATPLRLPAPLYDVVAVWDLGWGEASGPSRPGPNGSVAATVSRRSGTPSASTLSPSTPARSSFVVRVDSIVYRRGSEWVEIAIADVLSVSEVHWPAANPRGWVQVTYKVPDGVREVFFRQSNATSQATLVATISRAIELNREAATR